MYKSAFSSLDDNFFIIILFLSVQLFGCTSADSFNLKSQETALIRKDLARSDSFEGWFYNSISCREACRENSSYNFSTWLIIW